MTKYRKRPVVIDATQWFKMGDHPAVSSHNDCFSAARHEICPYCGHDYNWHGLVSTLEDGLGVAHVVCPGDWIITGIKGEHYACKPDIFATTYEPATLPT